MTSQQVADIIKDCETEPSAEVVDRLLDSARSLNGLTILIQALAESPRPWSARLIVLAANRVAATGSADAAGLSPLAFDLLDTIGPMEDWPAYSGFLDLLAWLCEDQGFVVRHDRDRVALLDLLWHCISHDHPNARSAPEGFLGALIDFGKPADVLGIEGIRSIRRKAEHLVSTSTTPAREQDDVAEFIALTHEAERFPNGRRSTR